VLYNNSLPGVVRMLFVSLLLTASSVIASAQSRISLTGRVTDQTGAAVGAATVTARQLGTSFERSTKTGDDGGYRVDDLLAGDYQVSARREGFSLAAQTLTLHSERGLDFTLRPGQLAADVSVVSTQLAATQEEQTRIPGSVEIIDARTLEISRPFNFNEALRKAPGVYTRDEEGFGLRPSIGIRGLDPNRSAKILLLEDGVPLGHAPYGDTDAYYHPPIERYNGIEILKGSSQITHGPNTLAGTINYITPNPPEGAENFSGSLTLLGGNRNYFNGYASAGASFGEGAGRTGLLFDFLRKQGQGARENMRFGLNDVLIKTVTKLTENGTQTLGFKFNYYGEDSNITYSGLTLAEFTANPRFNPFRNDFFNGDHFGGSVMYTNAINSRAVFTATIYGSDFNRDWWRQSSNYEAGFRSTPARGVKLSVAFFRLDYQNQIVPANLSGGAGATLTSAGETLHQGVEFDGRWDSGVTFNSPHNFYVRTAYTYVDTAEYQGTRFSNVSGFNTVSITGNRLIYSPKHLVATTAGYSHASGFDALVEAIHTGEQFGDDLNSTSVSPNGQRGLIPAYTVWNAAVNYRIGKLERYAPTVFVAVKNFADDTFIVDRRRGIMMGIPRLVQGAGNTAQLFAFNYRPRRA